MDSKVLVVRSQESPATLGTVFYIDLYYIGDDDSTLVRPDLIHPLTPLRAFCYYEVDQPDPYNRMLETVCIQGCYGYMVYTNAITRVQNTAKSRHK